MTGTSANPPGFLASALAQTQQLLNINPVQAEIQARKILEFNPKHSGATLLLGAALTRQGKLPDARDVLTALVEEEPRSPAAQFELGLVHSRLGDRPASIDALSRAVKMNPDLSGAWLALADEYTALGEKRKADDAFVRHLRTSVTEPTLVEAATALGNHDLDVAERLLRNYLKLHPTDPSAIRILAETGARFHNDADVERVLAYCVALAPRYIAARQNYATALYRQNKLDKALEQIDILIKQNPRHPAYQALRAMVLGRSGEYEKALAAYELLLKVYPAEAAAWMSYGHTLKIVGRQKDSIAAYRKSIALAPQLGEAWWGLANLKTFRFTAEEIAAMRAQLQRPELSDDNRCHLHFALGKALEDEGRFEESFENYRDANALRATQVAYAPSETDSYVRRAKALFTPAFFRAHEGSGNPAPDPIFIVGLPRAGSTLIEQILASHSAVEGTMELPDIVAMARALSGGKDAGPGAYPEVLATLSPEDIAELGSEYLERASIQRKRGAAFFIDKMPNNFLHIGFIRLILPKAKIIDARRYPLACCVSSYKQHFAQGQNFSYSLSNLGLYYARYVELMAHFDAVLPGTIHRVIYEELIADPEAEIHRLLDYCGLPFEESCLRFYENTRAVSTPSSEQVRMPIFKDGLDNWQNFEPWLGDLKTALGPVLAAYPGVPTFPAGAETR